MTISVLNYTNYNFEDILSQLQNKLAETDSWKDIYRSSTGETFMELWAGTANLILYYIERRAEESYLDTAQNKSSINNLVRLINYTPKRKTSATGVLTFTLAVANAYDIVIPRFTPCQTTSGIKILTNAETFISAGSLVASDIAAIQGTLGTVQQTADGTSELEININSTAVENSASATNPSIIIYVDGVLWTKVSSFIESIGISTHYRVITNNDDTIKIKFGNNVKGKIPEDGSTILIQYVISDGLAGNIYAASTVTTINKVINNHNGDAVTNISVSNVPPLGSTDASISGGDDAEDMEEVRYEAPRVFATGDRAVTRTDFVAILENMPSIISANVWGENEEAVAAGTTSDYEMLNKIKICVILGNWAVADTTVQAQVTADLYDQSIIAVKYEYVDPTILNIIPVLSVITYKGESQSAVQNDIETALEAQFALGSTARLGESVHYSNVISEIDAIDGISYHNMYFEIRKDLTAVSWTGGFDFVETLEAHPILRSSVKLFAKVDGVDVQLAVDDGDGVFTDTYVGYATAGTIYYDTGEIAISVDPASGTSDYYIRYQQDEERNLIVGFNEICKLYDVDITSITEDA